MRADSVWCKYAGEISTLHWWTKWCTIHAVMVCNSIVMKNSKSLKWDFNFRQTNNVLLHIVWFNCICSQLKYKFRCDFHCTNNITSKFYIYSDFKYFRTELNLLNPFIHSNHVFEYDIPFSEMSLQLFFERDSEYLLHLEFLIFDCNFEMREKFQFPQRLCKRIWIIWNSSYWRNCWFRENIGQMQ